MGSCGNCIVAVNYGGVSDKKQHLLMEEAEAD